MVYDIILQADKDTPNSFWGIYIFREIHVVFMVVFQSEFFNGPTRCWDIFVVLPKHNVTV